MNPNTVNLRTAQGASHPTERPTRSEDPNHNGSAKPLGSILVADDNPAFLDLTARLLRKGGYECDAARDGFETSKLLVAKEYDLLVTDLQMPGNRDLRLIRNAPRLRPGMPVILMTAFPTLESSIESISSLKFRCERAIISFS